MQNCSLAIVGKGEELSILDEDDITPHLEGLDQEERRGARKEEEEKAEETKPEGVSDLCPFVIV